MNNGPVDYNPVDKKRTFYWLDGLCEVLQGDSVADCMRSKGYSAGALHALDFVADGDTCGSHEWINGHWVLKKREILE